MGKSSIFVLFLLFFLCIAGLAAETAVAPDVQLAARLALHAHDFLLQGNTAQAITVAKHALTFNPDNSDALYISISNQYVLQEETIGVKAVLEHALDANTWALGYRRDALVAYSALLSRTYADQEIISLLESESNVDLDPELQYYLTLAYYRVGESDRALEAIATVQAPYDRRFFALRVMYSNRPFPDYELQRWLSANMLKDPAVLSLLRDYIVRLYLENAKNRIPAFLNYYMALEGKDPIVFLLAAATTSSEVANPLTTNDAINAFFTHGGANDKYLIDMIMTSDEHKLLQDELKKRMAGYTGTLIYDSNRDGYSEANYVIENEIITEWHIDDNQDGLAEWSISFTSQYPESIHTNTPEVLYEYYFYPDVGKITYYHEDYREIWYPAYNTISMPVVDYSHLIPDIPNLASEQALGVSFLQALTRVNPIVVPRITDIVAGGLFLRYRTHDNRVMYYRDGAVWLEARDTNADAKTDELYFLQQGVPISSMHDRDYNSVFEYFVLYENAVPSYTMIDEDGDNAIEYIVVANEIAFLPSNSYSIEEEHRQLETLYRFADRAKQEIESKQYDTP